MHTLEEPFKWWNLDHLIHRNILVSFLVPSAHTLGITRLPIYFSTQHIYTMGELCFRLYVSWALIRITHNMDETPDSQFQLQRREKSLVISNFKNSYISIFRIFLQFLYILKIKYILFLFK